MEDCGEELALKRGASGSLDQVDGDYPVEGGKPANKKAKASSPAATCDIPGCDAARVASSRFCHGHRRSVNALGDLAAKSTKDMRNDFKKILKERNNDKLKTLIDNLEERAPSLGRGRPRGSFDMAQMMTETEVSSKLITQGQWKPMSKGAFFGWYQDRENGAHTDAQSEAEWARMLNDPNFVKETWFGQPRCYVYTGLTVQGELGMASYQRLVEKDKEIKRPTAGRVEDMMQNLGIGVAGNLSSLAKGAGGLFGMAIEGATKAMLESTSTPHAAALAPSDIDFTDILVNKTVARNSSFAPTPQKGGSDEVSDIQDGGSSSKSRWEGRANQIIKASEAWDEKMDALRVEVDTLVKGAKHVLDEHVGDKAKGVEKWIVLVRNSLDGCQAWLDADENAMKQLMLNLWKQTHGQATLCSWGSHCAQLSVHIELTLPPGVLRSSDLDPAFLPQYPPLHSQSLAFVS